MLAEEIEELQIRVEETTLDAKLTAVDFSLRQLSSAAAEAGVGHAEVPEHANLRKAVHAARQRFAELAKREDLDQFLREGASLIKWQQFRTACVKLARGISRRRARSGSESTMARCRAGPGAHRDVSATVRPARGARCS